MARIEFPGQRLNAAAGFATVIGDYGEILLQRIERLHLLPYAVQPSA